MKKTLRNWLGASVAALAVAAAGFGASVQTPQAAASGVGTVNYVKGYGIALWQAPGAQPLHKWLHTNTSWQVYAGVQKGADYYFNLGGKQYIQGRYLDLKNESSSQSLKAVGKVQYVKDYGIALWTSPTSKKLVAGKKLKHGTAWKVVDRQVVSGHSWYKLGTNQWIDGKYFQLTKQTSRGAKTYTVSPDKLLSQGAKPSTKPDTKPSTDTGAASEDALAKLNYAGTQTVTVNNNQPTFSAADLSLSRGAWQTYSDLDSLNRVGAANAMLNQKLMPTAEREPLDVDPTGWHNKKIGNGYLYNRSHLIGYQLTGQNNNIKNLMTGTRSLNSPEMLHFEDDVTAYLKGSSSRYVRYQVTPIFRGNDLLARGVHMQARSIGDNTISFNVYIFNVEKGVTLNYADGTSNVGSDAGTEQKPSTPEQKPSTPDKKPGETQKPSTPATKPGTPDKKPAPDENDNRTVYYTATGKRYHFDKNCKGLSHAKKIYSETLKQAKAQGLTLCEYED